MCLAIPARVLKIESEQAKVDFGNGVTKEVDVSLVTVKEGDYVLVHAGYAIERVDMEEAKKTLEAWDEVLRALGTSTRETGRPN